MIWTDLTTAGYLERLIEEAGWVEIAWFPGPGRRISEWFDSAGAAAEYVALRMDDGDLYSSLNRVSAPPGGALKNEHVERIIRLPFDFDPVRKVGTGATDEQLALAKDRARVCMSLLEDFGWGLPLVGMSGNGFHLQYRVALPADDETKGALREIYRFLGERFTDSLVSFDQSVKNPGRIFRLYGTTNRKSGRVSRCWVPPEWRQVPKRLVLDTARVVARRVVRRRRSASPLRGGAVDYRELDVVRMFHDAGLYVKHIKGHIHEVICPWEDEHSSSTPGDTVIFEAQGDNWAGFHCKHAHCEGRDIRAVVSALGGDRAA